MADKGNIKPKLVIIEGKDKGRVLSLKDGTAILGRTKGDFLVPDPRVSRSHLALHYDAESLKLNFTDLKSLNGTFLNGEQKETGELKDGDKIQIGGTVLDCHISEESQEESIRENIRQRRESSHSGGKIEPDLGMPVLSTDDVIRTNKHPRSHVKTELAEPKEPSKLLSKLPKIHLKEKWNALPKKQKGLFLSLILLLAVFVGMPTQTKKPFLNTEVDREIKRVESLVMQGRKQEALEESERLRTAFPEDSSVHLILGQMYVLNGKHDLAIASYQMAKALKPTQPIAIVRLLRIFLQKGKMEEANVEMKHLDKMLQEGESQPEFFEEAAELFLDYRELQYAEEKAFILAKALQRKIAPNLAIGYKLEAKILLERKKTSEAAEVLARALEKDPNDDWSYENMIYARLGLQDITSAEKWIEKWTVSRPQSAKAYLIAAYLRFNQKNWEATLPFARKSVELASAREMADPILPEAMHVLGMAYSQLGKAEEAAKILSQSCQLGYQASCFQDRETAQKTESQPSAQ